MADVTLRAVKKSFGKTDVIKGIDLEIADGEFVVFVGPSGCGKSTLLRMIAGLEDITSGELRIGGRVCNDDPPKRRGAAMVFQSYALYPHKTVRGNIAFGLRIAGVPKAEIAARIASAAETLEIEHLLDRKPSQLSGGQRQRVAIGRAIVRDPAVFLFDEPLSNLDAALRVNMRMEIARLHSRLGATMAYVTHDQVEAMTLADRIVVLDGGLARQIGSPMELYENPVDTFVAGFIGSPKMNFLPGSIARSDASEMSITYAGNRELQLPRTANLADGATVTLGVRPEDLSPVSDAAAGGPCIEGKIEVVERLGAQTQLGVRLDDGSLVIAIAPGQLQARVNDPVTLALAMDKLHLFDGSGVSIPRPAA